MKPFEIHLHFVLFLHSRSNTCPTVTVKFRASSSSAAAFHSPQHIKACSRHCAMAVLVKTHNRYRPGTLPGRPRARAGASGWAGDRPARPRACGVKLNLAAIARSQVLLQAIESRADSESIQLYAELARAPSSLFIILRIIQTKMANLPMLKRSET